MACIEFRCLLCDDIIFSNATPLDCPSCGNKLELTRTVIIEAWDEAHLQEDDDIDCEVEDD